MDLDSVGKDRLPAWVTFPGDEWDCITPQDAGLDVRRWAEFLEQRRISAAAWEGERHEAAEYGCVFTRAGRVLRAWGDPESRLNGLFQLTKGLSNVVRKAKKKGS